VLGLSTSENFNLPFLIGLVVMSDLEVSRSASAVFGTVAFELWVLCANCFGGVVCHKGKLKGA
jgi:hypothetical protein